jgi:hypothetical protein
VGPLALYVASLVPGVAFWDTGEMQTVPTILGIAHPTGFPAFVLLGWLFAHALPVATPAWRVSFLSACCAAGAAWLLFRLVRALVADAWVAVAAAWTYAAGDVVWTRAARAEVHDLALFFTALALAAAALAGRRRDGRGALVAAAACGCGMATHPVVALAVPSVVLLAWPALRELGGTDAARIVAAGLAPLALYLYLPLRSAQIERSGADPVAALGLQGGAFWNYDAPSTPQRFASYVSGASFHPVAAFAAATTRTGAADAAALARMLLGTEFGAVMLALIITGFFYLARFETRLAVAFGLLALALFAFAPNFAAESDTLRYALPSLWAAGVCAGVGAWWLTQSLVRERSGPATAIAAGLLAIALWPNVAYALRDVERQRSLDDATRFTADVVRFTPDDALVVASWTYATPLAYAAYVAHSFGKRRLVSGWPYEYSTRYASWRARFKHIYLVVPARYDAADLATRVFATSRWQIAEVRS